jgi:hypothetical protein
MKKRSNNNGRKSGGSMATDMNRLQGEIEENPRIPALHENDVDASVERLIAGLLRALLDEQKPAAPSAPIPLPATGNEIPSFLQLRSTLAKESV